MDDIDAISSKLGIPWETSKDILFSFRPVFIGLIWDLRLLTVELTPARKEKYLSAIQAWSTELTHVLKQVQELYRKLLHSCLVLPAGCSRLVSFESMLAHGQNRPFVPRHAPAIITTHLAWWTGALRSETLRRPIPCPVTLFDAHAYLDASSGIGITIVIGSCWQAWRLIPGWITLNGAKDIGWAEAVGFELLVHALLTLCGHSHHYKLYGDNKGVVEGWWKGRSKNSAVNTVFQRIQDYLASLDAAEIIHSTYVPSAQNPADKPSRGICPSNSLLLPPITLHPDLFPFLVDSQSPLSPTELRLHREGTYSVSASKFIINKLEAESSQREHTLQHFKEDCQALGL